MKKLLFILSISFLFLFSSCSGDDETMETNPDTNALLLKKLTSSTGWFIEFIYNDNKLNRLVHQDKSYILFTYADNLIIRTDDINSNGQPTGSKETYEYTNNKITKRNIYSENELVEVWLISYLDKKIKITRPEENPNTNYTLLYLDSNENIIKSEFYVNGKVIESGIMTYDNKINPFRNMLGLNLFIQDIEVSHNNLVSSTYRGSNGEVESYNTFTYEYNKFNYPISSIDFDSYDNSEVFYTYHY